MHRAWTQGTDDSLGNATGNIVGQPNDPVAELPHHLLLEPEEGQPERPGIQPPAHVRQFRLRRVGQLHLVHSGLKYDNASVGEQFALVGLSNSANLVGIFENDKWSVRAAYNWRDEFLASTFDSAGPNPQYVEAYGQLDLSVGYNISEKLSLQFEAINLTNETARVHGRSKEQALYVTQSGPRYSIGARYKF
jgi:hypothetical protein